MIKPSDRIMNWNCRGTQSVVADTSRMKKVISTQSKDVTQPIISHVCVFFSLLSRRETIIAAVRALLVRSVSPERLIRIDEGKPAMSVIPVYGVLMSCRPYDCAIMNIQEKADTSIKAHAIEWTLSDAIMGD